jgi:peptidoglycan/xylan/chitin deacetylase (PgdA/CDA1 family)
MRDGRDDEGEAGVGEGTAARLVLVGMALVGLLVGATGSSHPGRPTAAAAADARTAALRGPEPGPAAGRATTTTATTRPPRALPVPPRARPLTLAVGRSAPALSRLPITDKVVFLGIDDGNVRDPAVLDQLDRYRLPFTVFLTMGPAQADPAFWRRAVAAGGTIQSHTLTHPDLTRLGGSSLRNEVCGTIEAYTALGGRRPTLFRPPYGKVNDAVRRQAAECGYRAVIMWQGSTNNGRLTMQDGGGLQPGDILLLHWRDTLAADIDDVVARCRQEGFTVGRLEDYLP